MRNSDFTITVNKAELIEAITQNRDEHRNIFLAAQEKYQQKVIEVLELNLAAARRGEKVEHYIRLPIPVDYTEEYNAALDMLGWEVADQVTLDQDMFTRLIRNQWEWTSNFATNTVAYTEQA